MKHRDCQTSAAEGVKKPAPSIPRTVLLALKNIKGEVVDRPKALGDIRGVTYIYGIFYRFGLIDVPDEVKEKMGRPINSKK